MPKAIPKKKGKSASEIDAYLDQLEEELEPQSEFVDTIMTIQSTEVTEIVDKMVESLENMQGPPRMRVRGVNLTLNEDQFDRLQEIRDKQFVYMAVRILVACAEWGIVFGNFKLPKSNCAKCGKKVKK